MTFVFASLVELAIIGYQAKKSDEKKKRKLVEYDEMLMTQPPEAFAETVSYITNETVGHKHLLCCMGNINFVGFLKAQQVDFYAKLLFPAFYSLFNVSTCIF